MNESIADHQIDNLLSALSIESAMPELTAMNHEAVRTWIAAIGPTLITGISVVQMIQALRGCVQQLNQSSDHNIALKAQQSIVGLDELRRDLTLVWGDDEPYKPWPLIPTQYETDREREIREWNEQQAREQQP